MNESPMHGEIDVRQFNVYGKVRGKGRPKFARMGTFVRAYTDDKTVNYENLVKVSYGMESAYKGWKPFADDVPLRASITAYMPWPKSWSAKKRGLNTNCLTKPDGDNIVKVILDALNGVAFHDDSQVAMISLHKRYHADEPVVVVTLERIV